MYMQELRIKEVMQEKGITQKRLAEQMGVAEISLSRSLRGNPTLETLSKIAEALEVDIVDLFERKKEKGNTMICPKCGSKFKLIE